MYVANALNEQNLIYIYTIFSKWKFITPRVQRNHTKENLCAQKLRNQFISTEFSPSSPLEFLYENGPAEVQN